MNFLSNLDPSARRLLFGFLTPFLAVLFNNKAGLGLTEEQLNDLVNLGMTYLATSNAKDAVLAVVARRGQEAAATVKTPEDADKQLSKSLIWLLVAAIAFAPSPAVAQDAGVVLFIDGQPTTRPVPPEPPKLLVMKAGDIAPADGRWVRNDAWANLGAANAKLEAENIELKSKVSWPVWVPVVAAVVGVGIGAGVTFGIMKGK